MSTAEKRRLRPSEYLAIEVASEGRHEFYDGEMFAMSAGSYWHKTAVADPAGAVDFKSLGITVPVAEIYADVEFLPAAGR